MVLNLLINSARHMNAHAPLLSTYLFDKDQRLDPARVNAINSCTVRE